MQAFARRHFPAAIRRPLGWLVNRFDETVLRTVDGLIFDLQGGRFHADGCTFAVPKHLTPLWYRSAFRRREYEADERALVRRHVQGPDRIIELGGCLGVVSCVANKLLDDPAAHVVVEGNPLCIPVLEQNKTLNAAGFRIEHCAVSGGSEVSFFIHPVYIVGGTTQRKTDRVCRVPGKSLASLDAEFGPFTVLIMDVEGSEWEVLAESQAVLQNYRLVIAELHDWAIGKAGVEDCRRILRAAGFLFEDSAGLTEVWRRPAP